MKRLAVVIASVFNLLVFGNAYAHGDHPSEHGGVVGRGDDAIVVEFVMEKGTINVYVHDEAGKPLATKNVTGTLTVIAPQRPAQEVKLVRAGDDKFTAPGLVPAPGDRLRARITLPSGEALESVGLFAGESR
jgi:nitrogen fixation protein FixH